MNCKPGDIALVLGGGVASDVVRPLDWSIVTVIEYIGDYQYNGTMVRRAWLVGSSVVKAPRVWISDDYLRPIRPPEQPVQVGQLEGIGERVS